MGDKNYANGTDDSQYPDYPRAAVWNAFPVPFSIRVVHHRGPLATPRPDDSPYVSWQIYRVAVCIRGRHGNPGGSAMPPFLSGNPPRSGQVSHQLVRTGAGGAAKCVALGWRP